MSNTIKIINTRILSDYRYLLKQVTFSVNGEEEQKKKFMHVQIVLRHCFITRNKRQLCLPAS